LETKKRDRDLTQRKISKESLRGYTIGFCKDEGIGIERKILKICENVRLGEIKT
jgi:hypothetical protein